MNGALRTGDLIRGLALSAGVRVREVPRLSSHPEYHSSRSLNVRIATLDAQPEDHPMKDLAFTIHDLLFLEGDEVRFGAYSHPPHLEYQRPTSHADAVKSLAGDGSSPLGGGTDLLVAMREGILRSDRLVDLRSLPSSNDITWSAGGSLRLGASVTIASIAADERVRREHAALAQACESVGSPALRHMGTIGGNLCQRPRCWYFRSGIPCLKSSGSDCPAFEGENTHHSIFGGGPCYAVHPSDPAVALTALEATVHVSGPGGDRVVPIGDFFVLPDPDPKRETILERGEFVAAIELPARSSNGRQRYTKVLQRGAWDFALASIAVVRRTDGTVRMVLGGVAPIPWPVNPSVEEDVASAPLSSDDIEVLAERALYDAQPLSRNGYKVSLCRALLRDAIQFAS